MSGDAGCFIGNIGGVHIEVSDEAAYYGNMLRAYAPMAETREMPIPLETTLEIIRILAA
jgi:hypothetical protein